MQNYRNYNTVAEILKDMNRDFTVRTLQLGYYSQFCGGLGFYFLLAKYVFRRYTNTIPAVHSKRFTDTLCRTAGTGGILCIKQQSESKKGRAVH